MDPAYSIPLEKKELEALGELTVIMGQVDDLMVQLVAILLNIDRKAANVVMGSSKIGDNSSIWANAIRNRTADEDILWLAEHANKEIEAVSKDRNDFIHAVFEPVWMPAAAAVMVSGGGRRGGGTMIGRGIVQAGATARRVRSDIKRSTQDLVEIRNRAARLSCLVAHIALLATGKPVIDSPWHGKFDPALPLRLDTVAERKAKAQRGQPKPSRAKP